MDNNIELRELKSTQPKDVQGALPEWAYFERVDHEDGKITYESHGRESIDIDYEASFEEVGEDTFICIDGSRAKEVAERIRTALMSHCPGWQPIETAPRDGTLVTLFDNYGKNHFECHWDGIVWAGVQGYEVFDYGEHPTHWMPLPTPPETTEE